MELWLNAPSLLTLRINQEAWKQVPQRWEVTLVPTRAGWSRRDAFAQRVAHGCSRSPLWTHHSGARGEKKMPRGVCGVNKNFEGKNTYYLMHLYK